MIENDPAEMDMMFHRLGHSAYLWRCAIYPESLDSNAGNNGFLIRSR